MKKKGPMKLMGKKKSAAKQKMKMVNVGGKKVPAFAADGKGANDIKNSGAKMKKAAMKLKKDSMAMMKKSAMEMKKVSAMKMKMKASAAKMKKAAMKMKKK